MPVNQPFGPDAYRDNRDKTQKGNERKEVIKQRDSLASRAIDNEHRRTTVGKIQMRRTSVPGTVPVVLVPRADKLDLVVAAQSLLIKAADLDGDETVATKLRNRGIVENARTGGIVQLTVPADTARDDIEALVAKIQREDGITVSMDLVTPLGVWMKGEGGPEPSMGARAFPAVEISEVAEPPKVAVIDTGISNKNRDDGYLGAGIAPAEADPLDVFPAPDGLLDADAGHGSFVTGVVQQVAPTSPVGCYRVADSDGIATTFQVAEKMRLAVRHGATILNLSLGTDSVGGQPPIALQDVVTELANHHSEVLIVCAAGNWASTDEVWPAAFAATSDNVVAVAALDPDGAPAAWSSHGPWVTCSAIAEGTVSTYVEGTENGPLIGDPYPDTFKPPNPWAAWTGTSFAAPQIAGAIARICTENEDVTPRQALAMLKDLATPATDGEGYGWKVEILPGTGD